jgi:hypothetical protein
VRTHFGDSAGESTTPTMKKGDSGTNGSDLNKSNIIKSTLDHLSEEDLKVEEIFLLCYEVTRQGLIQKDAVSINIYNFKVPTEVRFNPSLSFDDVQVMIHSTLERQEKSNNELMCRLIEERDEKKLVDSNVHTSSSSSSSCVVNFAQTNSQPSGTSTGGTS